MSTGRLSAKLSITPKRTYCHVNSNWSSWHEGDEERTFEPRVPGGDHADLGRTSRYNLGWFLGIQFPPATDMSAKLTNPRLLAATHCAFRVGSAMT
jgi:hypothetical protein